MDTPPRMFFYMLQILYRYIVVSTYVCWYCILDLAKTFDCIDQGILLQKIPCCDNALSWLATFFA